MQFDHDAHLAIVARASITPAPWQIPAPKRAARRVSLWARWFSPLI